MDGGATMAAQNKKSAPAHNITKKRKRRRRKQHRVASTIMTFLLSVFLIIGLTGCMVVFTVFQDIGLLDSFYSTLGIHTASANDDIAGVDYIDLNELIQNQSQTTIIYALNNEGNEIEIARLHGTENRIWVSLNETSEHLQNAYIALEDFRFKEHQGVDWVRTIGGVVLSGFKQGGSSITQQLIKNLTGENGRTFIRKYNEIKNALKLEQHFSKDTILEAYMNTLYLDMGCYGVKTGAEYYFDKDPADLTIMESAILASITNAPRKYNPLINFENNRSRAIGCLEYMLEYELISQEEFDAALEENVQFSDGTSVYSHLGLTELTEPEENDELVDNEDAKENEDEDLSEDESVEIVYVDEHNPEYQSYYIDLIIDMLIEDFQTAQGLSYEDAWKKVYYGGLKVYAAVDLDVQYEMEEVYYNRVTFPYESNTAENPGIQSAMTVMGYDGRIVGIVGKLDPKVGNRTLNIAASSPRQPGSSIKPLSAYAPAIELNYFYWSSYIPNYGIEIPSEEDVWPQNYGGSKGSPDDLRNLMEAIAPSLNTIPARIVQTITPATCYTFLKDRFHISTLTSGDADYAPLAVGSMNQGVTTLEMAAAYAVFGNGGYYFTPYSYYKVTNASGSEVYFDNTNPIGEQVMSEGSAYVMNKLLQTVVNSYIGTGYGYDIDNGYYTIPSYAKSGTTTDNNDKWYACGTPYYVCAAWVGYEYPKEIDTDYFGLYPAAKVVQEVMNRIHKGLDYKEFEETDEAVQRTFCTNSGRLATSSCYSTDVGWYKVSNIPSYCTSCTGWGGWGNRGWGYGYEEDDEDYYGGYYGNEESTRNNSNNNLDDLDTTRSNSNRMQ